MKRRIFSYCLRQSAVQLRLQRRGRLLIVVTLVMGLVGLASPLLAQPLGWPNSRVTPVWQTELSGGWSDTASPTIADVRSDYAGQEIIVGAKQRNESGSGYSYAYPGSIALLSAAGSVIWQKTNYTVGGTSYPIGSVWSSAAVGDIDGDGAKEIVVGLGADETIVNRGGVLALNQAGGVKWYYATADRNYPGNGPNGLPDGVRSTPALADLNGDGVVEVVVSGGDMNMHVINGRTGQSLPGWPVDLLDSNFSSAAVADIDGNGHYEFAFGGDMGYSANCIPLGGIFRVMRYDATYPPGFDGRLDCNPWVVLARGKSVDQTIYSSPVIGDINKDGQLEIAVGSGNYFAGKGHWVKVWAANGTLLATLATNGFVDGEPALADLNGDGYLDIIAATEQEATVYAWSGRPADNWGLLPGWGVKAWMFNNTSGPIFGSPVVADLVPSSSGPEVLVANGSEITVFAANGTQLTSKTGVDGKPTFWLGNAPTAGTPAVADIDGDGKLEIVAAGSYWDPPNWDPAHGNPNWKESVFAWRWPGVSNNASGALPWPQFRRTAAHLGRAPMPATLGASPTTIRHMYAYQSGDPTTLSGSFFLSNAGDAPLSYSLSRTSSIPFSFTSPTNGTLEPLASVKVDYTLSVASLTPGTYPTNVTAMATSGGSPASGSPQSIVINAVVGTFKDVFLPIIVKGN
jgi:hypothetical protein